MADAGGGAPDLLGGPASQFGLINSLRTGNMILDMLVCMIIPMFFGGVTAGLQGGPQQCRKFIQYVQSRNQVLRTISHEKKVNSWGCQVGSTNSDHLLLKAVMLYLSRHDPGKHKAATITLTDRPVKELLKLKDEEGGAAAKKDDDCDSYYDSDEEENDQHYELAACKKMKVSQMPPEDTWVAVGDGVELMKCNSRDEPSGDGKANTAVQTETASVTLRATGHRAEERINAFVDKAYAYFMTTLEGKRDEKRYMFVMLHGGAAAGGDGDGGGGASQQRTYKRYELSSEKTFESLFFPGKSQLLFLLDHFQAKTGKFAIKGFPHKLGLLLYGPPGTGKTSLIKAVAHHTKRHIVSVPLSKIKTNQELMDVMFDQSFKVVNTLKSSDDDSDMPIPLSFAKVIFVMEDVDAASSVVQRRAKGTTKTTTIKVTRHPTNADAAGDEAPLAAKRERSARPPSRQPSRQPSALTEEKGEEGGKVFAPKAADEPKADGEAEAAGEDEVVEEVTTVVQGPAGKEDKGKAAFGKEDEDKLDLAGLLNVLDGVVDSPQRIVIMTTNHPEKLDPALIRPGRINKKMLLGYLLLPEATRMVEHYFGALSKPQEDAFAAGFTPNVFTPAQVEQLCAEYDSFEEFLGGLHTLQPNEY